LNSSKVGLGETIAGISGLLLFIFMFLPWYGIDSVGGFGIDGEEVSAWEAFSFIDMLLFLIAVVVVGLVLVQLAEVTPDLPRPPAQIVMVAGAVAFALILFRMIVAPGVDSDFGLEVDLGRKLGILLGLITAAGITYGGWRAMNEPAE